MNRKIKILIGFTSVLIIIMLISPTLIKNYLVNNSKELIGRKLMWVV
ncbi:MULTISPECIES: hypothetical protein [unclassified Winogradskyella]|nr:MULTISPECIES: hypothetical protein [unclassified Winogradskyella]